MISCRNLTKHFDEFAAVEGVSFDVPAGTIFAFLGPNGAGKSTVVKMLTGLLKPSAGEASVAGFDVRKRELEFRRAIGVLPENLGLFDALTVEEHLLLSGPIYGLSKAETRSRAGQLLRALQLDDGRNTFANQCSYGMRKKTALAMALLHNPRVLFLDEPFEGIDPVMSKTLRDLLAALAQRGVAIFLTSHILSIVERLATRIAVIQHGKIVWNSLASELPQSLEEHYLGLVQVPIIEELPWLGLPPS
ncbi:MAG: ABC transporter ATP-binding protein [Acidobacteriota bacterium]|nr:ABC transporter ATP-binding protein [Acidobacteriota bacterium]